MNFDESFIYLCTLDMMLVIDRSTKEPLCELDLRTIEDGSEEFKLPAGLVYGWPMEPPPPRTYRVSPPPMRLEALIPLDGRWDALEDVFDDNLFVGSPV